jgi:hypothetical protein
LVQAISGRGEIDREDVDDAVHLAVAVDVDAGGADASECFCQGTGPVAFERDRQVCCEVC